MIGLLRRAGTGLGRAEAGLSILVLAAMAVLPILEIILRKTIRVGVPGSILIVQHLTLLIAFLGAALAAREGKLLALSTASFVPERLRGRLRLFGHAAGAGVSAWLAVAALDFVRSEMEAGRILVLGVPLWVVLSILPIGSAAIALRLAPAERGEDRQTRERRGGEEHEARSEERAPLDPGHGREESGEREASSR